jgi:hypothetical protein
MNSTFQNKIISTSFSIEMQRELLESQNHVKDLKEDIGTLHNQIENQKDKLIKLEKNDTILYLIIIFLICLLAFNFFFLTNNNSLIFNIQ